MAQTNTSSRRRKNHRSPFGFLCFCAFLWLFPLPCYHPASIGQTRRSNNEGGIEMSYPLQVKFTRLVLVIAVVIISAVAVYAQGNPYRLAEGWPQLPAGVKFGAVISVDADARGNIWVFHRSDPTILQFAPTGKMLKSFGAGMFVQPHGMTIY